MHSFSFKTAGLLTILLACNTVGVCLAQDKAPAALSASAAPSENFDLSNWKLSVPTDSDNNGRSDSIFEAELNKGYQNPDYFYTAADGGMVFKVPIKGYKTSKNTSYTRTELREMLRRGDKSIDTRTKSGLPNKNNWVFSSAPAEAQKLAGAVDGVLEATVAVNYVTTTGRDNQVGRVIIGQIHAEEDEPIRLYYHKLPKHERGTVYAAHEPLGKKDKYYDLIGGRRSKVSPKDGFALDEKFSYKIVAKGNELHVTISDSAGKTRAQETIDMSRSGYDQKNDFMYFKAGAYNQNKSGKPDDYVQVTFYKLSATHDAKTP